MTGLGLKEMLVELISVEVGVNLYTNWLYSSFSAALKPDTESFSLFKASFRLQLFFLSVSFHHLVYG